MKIISLFSILFLGLNVFAGPEEHKAAQSCYYLQKPAGAVYVSPKVPQQVCLEQLTIDPWSQSASAYSYFQPELFKNIRVQSLKSIGTGLYGFKLSSVVSETGEACGEGETVELLISGTTDSTGIADPSKLQVSVDYASTDDVCHSPFESQTYSYTSY